MRDLFVIVDWEDSNEQQSRRNKNNFDYNKSTSNKIIALGHNVMTMGREKNISIFFL